MPSDSALEILRSDRRDSAAVALSCAACSAFMLVFDGGFAAGWQLVWSMMFAVVSSLSLILFSLRHLTICKKTAKET